MFHGGLVKLVSGTQVMEASFPEQLASFVIVDKVKQPVTEITTESVNWPAEHAPETFAYTLRELIPLEPVPTDKEPDITCLKSIGDV